MGKAPELGARFLLGVAGSMTPPPPTTSWEHCRNHKTTDVDVRSEPRGATLTPCPAAASPPPDPAARSRPPLPLRNPVLPESQAEPCSSSPPDPELDPRLLIAP